MQIDTKNRPIFVIASQINSEKSCERRQFRCAVRHNVLWQEEEFYDEEKLDEELRRVFDICHGCRRCFNLCDSFPKLFDLIDESDSGELDSVESADFKPIVDACTLCDMCFLTKCPRSPHEFNLDFPRRYRAIEFKKGEISFN